MLRVQFGAFIGAILLAAGVTFALLSNSEAAPPPRPEQPHGDQFDIAGFGNLAQYNPMDAKVKNQRTAVYRLETLPSCNTGVIPDAMRRVEAEAFDKLRNLRIVRNDAAPDFTVYVNCGSDQIRRCGSVDTFCLNRGFPYSVDMDISDVLSTYQSITQLSILLHEVVGHALATWDEQYCKGTETTGICRGLGLFASAPGWRDVMNTGPNSRHGLEAIEIERWSRTMYDVLEQIPPVDPCAPGPPEPWGGRWHPCIERWVGVDGFSWSPKDGTWWGPGGGSAVPEFSDCNSDHIRFALQAGRWMTPGSGYFNAARGYWAFVPSC